MGLRVIIAIGLLIPFPVLAESVAVLPISYKSDLSEKRTEERSQKLMEALVDTVRQLGLEPVTGPHVDRESRAFSPLADTVCASAECPEEVASRVEADLGVAVSIVEESGRADIKIYTSFAEPIVFSTFDTFLSLVRRISEGAEKSLKKGLQYVRSAKSDAEDVEYREGGAYRAPLDMSGQIRDDELPGGRSRSDDSERSDRGSRDRKRLKPAGFWSSFGITMALGAGYGVVEGIGYAKWQADKSPPSDERQGVETLRLTSRILVGATAAGVVATTVVALFTDFKDRKKKKRKERRDDEDDFSFGEKEDDEEMEEEEEEKEEEERPGGYEEEEEKLYFEDRSKDLFGGLDFQLAPIFGNNGGGVAILGTF